MFQQFYELFNALNNLALENKDQDLTLIERAQRDVLESWIDYIAFTDKPLSDEEHQQYSECLAIVARF